MEDENGIERLDTIKEMARRCSCPEHRIRYVVRTRGIRPAAWVGNVGIFRKADAEKICRIITAIAARRSAAPCPAGPGMCPAGLDARSSASGRSGRPFTQDIVSEVGGQDPEAGHGS